MDRKLNSAQQKGLESLSFSKFFRGVVGHVRSRKGEWMTVLDKNHAEDDIPECWTDYASLDFPTPSPALGVRFGKIYDEVMRLSVLKVFRPDRFMAGALKFVESVFGE